MTTTIEQILDQIQKEADEFTPELLPMLLERLMKRPALATCERHDSLLFPYIRAQIFLTRAKRNYYRYGDSHDYCLHRGSTRTDPTESTYIRATNARDEIRKQYRSTPCTCWVQHR